jgi:hypothetical protein
VAWLLQPGAAARVVAAGQAQAAEGHRGTPSTSSVARDALLSRQATGIAIADARMRLETPSAGATVSRSFEVSGWAIDPAAPAGTGIDLVQVYAYPNFGSGEAPVSLGFAEYGLARPDVAAQFGSQFAASGFAIAASNLPAGAYRVIAFAHTVATNAFSAYVFADVSVAAVRTLVVDTPAENATANQGFTIAGWAIDNGAAAGSGIDAIHLYVAPATAPDRPMFLGVATLDVARDDVGGAYGAQFSNAGYVYSADGFASGDYVLYVYAHSSVTGTFCLGQTRRFTVRATTRLSIDLAALAPGSRMFNVAGWAIDTAAATGTGIDALHVYALPAGGGAAIFLGVATLGVARADVGAAYGDRFASSGYLLSIDADMAGLTAGAYDVVVWAHSSAANAFTTAAVVRVTMP